MVRPDPLVDDDGGSAAAALEADAQNRAAYIVLRQRMLWAIAYLQHLVDTGVIGPAVIPTAPVLKPVGGVP